MIAASSGYSASVESSLVVGERKFSISNVGRDRCILRQPSDLPPSEAEIVLSIDGLEQRSKVFLLDGISSASKHVRFRDVLPEEN